MVEETAMGSTTNTFTFAEVVRHNRNCWVIVNGKVYDVTLFLDDHPGGGEILMSMIGKDVTADFEGFSHSETAQELMKTFFVGEIDTTTLPAPVTNNSPLALALAPASAPNQSSLFFFKMLHYLMPLLILTFVYVLRNYYGKGNKYP